MRRRICFLLALCLSLSLLGGCAGDIGESSAFSKPETETSEISSAVQDASLASDIAVSSAPAHEVFPLWSNGVGVPLRNSVSVSDTTDLGGVAAIYKNPYPQDSTGRSGLLLSPPGLLPYYELQAEDKKEIAAGLDEFLAGYYGKPAGSLLEDFFYPAEEGPLLAYYKYEGREGAPLVAAYSDEKNGIRAYVYPTYFAVFSEDCTNLKHAMRKGYTEAILDSHLVKPALAYLGIDQPQIANLTQTSADGEPNQYVYKITEKPDGPLDEMYRLAFERIALFYLCDEKTSKVILDVRRYQPEKAAEAPVVSYDAALAYIRETYPKEMAGELKCGASYLASVNTAQYIPCYKFVGEAGDARYVAMTEYDETAVEDPVKKAYEMPNDLSGIPLESKLAWGGDYHDMRYIFFDGESVFWLTNDMYYSTGEADFNEWQRIFTLHDGTKLEQTRM